MANRLRTATGVGERREREVRRGRATCERQRGSEITLCLTKLCSIADRRGRTYMGMVAPYKQVPWGCSARPEGLQRGRRPLLSARRPTLLEASGLSTWVVPARLGFSPALPSLLELISTPPSLTITRDGRASPGRIGSSTVEVEGAGRERQSATNPELRRTQQL